MLTSTIQSVNFNETKINKNHDNLKQWVCVCVLHGENCLQTFRENSTLSLISIPLNGAKKTVLTLHTLQWKIDLYLFHALFTPPELLTSQATTATPTTLKCFIVGMKPMSIGRNSATEKKTNSIIECIKRVWQQKKGHSFAEWNREKRKKQTHK